MQVRVRQGDTLWYYSQLFGLPLMLLVDSNPQLNPGALQIGQAVNIPGFAAASYEVQPGDTMWTIAQRRGLSVDALLLLNPGIDPARLSIGQTLAVPQRVTWRIVQARDGYTSSMMLADLQRLTDLYPFVRRRDIGASVMNKPIPELRIGRGAKQVHWNASMHANEWITTPVLVQFLNDYLLALTNWGNIRGLELLPFYSAITLSVVPMVNPDGVDLVIDGPPEEEPYRSSVLEMNGGSADFSGWKANIRGVDLNDQFPARWELEAERRPKEPSPRDYPGTAPLTEPESQAIAALTRESDFAQVLAFHTQGEVIYWGFLGYEPDYAEAWVNEYARVSGYTPIRYVDSYAGYKDWFIQDWRRPGFTVELGSGVNPLPWSQFPEIYEETLGILLASLYVT
jgi:g-D-glutamyl-meso-diaminopimelate peptidase